MIQNNRLVKCLQALLIGYFLLSSLNISGSFGHILDQNAGLNSVKGMTCQVIKKLFKCDGMPEEMDDYESCKTKPLKSGKGNQLLEYIVPADAFLPGSNRNIEKNSESYKLNSVLPFDFYNKIHLPPPEFNL